MITTASNNLETIRISSTKIVLIAKGWSRVRELEMSPVKDVSQVFVAMWFSEEMNAAWEKGIKLAIQQAGFRALRIDK